jgi:hypothetical protein
MAGVSADEKYQIVAGNVMDYFGLDPVVFH